jgi:hypothetical protein
LPGYLIGFNAKKEEVREGRFQHVNLPQAQTAIRVEYSARWLPTELHEDGVDKQVSRADFLYNIGE